MRMQADMGGAIEKMRLQTLSNSIAGKGSRMPCTMNHHHDLRKTQRHVHA